MRVSLAGTLAVVVGFGTPVAAQDLDQTRGSLFTRFLEMGSMIRGGSVQPHWFADGSSFWYRAGEPGQTTIVRVDARANTRAPLFDVPRLRRVVAEALGHEPPFGGVPFETFTLGDRETAIRFSLEGRSWQLDLATYRLTSVTPPTDAEQDPTTARLVRRGFPETVPDVFELRSPTGQWFLTEREHNLVLRSATDGRIQPLTTDGTEEQAWEVAGARWSPDGLRLAAFRVDHRGVSRIPLVHWLKTEEEVEWRYFTRTGGRLPRPVVYLIDVLSKRAVEVALGPEPEPYLSIVDWTPDGSALVLLAMERGYKRLRVLAVEPATGATRTILTESQPTFVRGIDIYPRWQDLVAPVGDGKRLVVISERDGWNHLYLYGLDGTLIRRLTSGTWPVLKVLAIDQSRGWVYFTGHAEPRRYDTHLYRVNLDGSGFARLTDGDGNHAPVLSPSRDFFLDTRSSVAVAPVVELRTTGGKLVRPLSSATITELKALGWTPPEEVVVKAADGNTDLYGVLFKPMGFDSAKKYPVIEYIYGGPQGVVTPRTFTVGSWQQALAALGFVVWVVDGRGTPERGKAFQDFTFGQFGQVQIPEHVAALKHVAATRPYLDLSRVGLYGWSWGGYMTIRGLLLAPDVYHVGVSIFPVVDLYDHMGTPLEGYMGLPADNPKGYEEGSNLKRVGELRRPLMLVHGTGDVDATFSATMKMVDALTRAGKPYDLVVIPELNHSLSGPSRDYWMGRMWRFFVERLRP